MSSGKIFWVREGISVLFPLAVIFFHYAVAAAAAAAAVAQKHVGSDSKQCSQEQGGIPEELSVHLDGKIAASFVFCSNLSATSSRLKSYQTFCFQLWVSFLRSEKHIEPSIKVIRFLSAFLTN